MRSPPLHQRHRARGTAIAALIAPALTGCMTLIVDGGDAPPTLTRHLGLLQVSLGSGPRAQVGSLSGVGLASTPLGITLGYTTQRWAVLGPRCHAVLWVDRGRLSSETLEQLRSVAGVCWADELKAGMPPGSSTSTGSSR